MVGERIYFFRKRNGLTQEQLAHGICSISHLSKIENGHEIPSDHILEHLCKRLNISPKEVNNRDELATINETLDAWYSHLCDRNMEESDRLQEELKEKMIAVHDPTLLLKYKVFWLEYSLLRKDPRTAQQLVEELMPFMEKLDGHLQFYFFFIFGNYYYTRGEYLVSLKYYRQAEEVGEKIRLQAPELFFQLAIVNLAEKIRLQAPELFFQLAIVNLALYRTYFSAKYADLALSLYNERCNYPRSIDCQNVAAINAIRVHHFAEAEKHLDDALHVSRLLHQADGLSWTYGNLGYLAFQQGESDVAIEHFEKSLTLNRRKENQDKNIGTYYRMAKVFYERNDAAEARQWIERGLTFSEELGSLEYTLHFKAFQSKLVNDPASQEALLKEEVIPYFHEQGIWFYVAKYSEMLAEHYAQQFKYKASTHYYHLVNEAQKNVYGRRKHGDGSGASIGARK